MTDFTTKGSKVYNSLNKLEATIEKRAIAFAPLYRVIGWKGGYIPDCAAIEATLHCLLKDIRQDDKLETSRRLGRLKVWIDTENRTGGISFEYDFHL